MHPMREKQKGVRNQLRVLDPGSLLRPPLGGSNILLDRYISLPTLDIRGSDIFSHVDNLLG